MPDDSPSTRSGWRAYWDKKILDRREKEEEGLCIVSYFRTSGIGTVHVTCPFNRDFNTQAQELSGKWRHRTRVWVFRLASKRLVVSLCRRHFKTVKVVGFPDETSL